MEKISLLHVEHMAHSIAREHLRFDEPIPDFDSRFPGRLESTIAAPFQTFGGSDLFATIEEKAAALFYYMVKGHPFQNGNKRLAITTTTTFLFINDLWLDVDPNRLYDVTMWIAQSPASAKDEAIAAVVSLIRNNIKDIKHWKAAQSGRA